MPGLKMKGAKAAFNRLSGGGGQSGEYVSGLGDLMQLNRKLGDFSTDFDGETHHGDVSGASYGSMWSSGK